MSIADALVLATAIISRMLGESATDDRGIRGRHGVVRGKHFSSEPLVAGPLANNAPAQLADITPNTPPIIPTMGPSNRLRLRPQLVQLMGLPWVYRLWFGLRGRLPYPTLHY